MALFTLPQLLAMRQQRFALQQQQGRQSQGSGIFNPKNVSTAQDAIKGYRQGARIARIGDTSAVDSQFDNAFPALGNYEATSLLGASDPAAGLDAALSSGSGYGSLGSVGSEAGSDISYYMPDLASQGANLGTTAATGTEAASGATDAALAGTDAGTALSSALMATGVGAVGVLGTQMGNKYFATHGGAQGRNGWALANTANPENAFIEAPGMINSALHGQKFTTEQKLGTALTSGGASLAYNPALDISKGEKVDQKDIGAVTAAALATGPAAPLTFAALELYNLGVGMFGGKKGKDQQARDAYRSGLQKAGALDKDWNLTLADGSKYDFGADGKSRLANTDGGSRRTYDLDFKNPLTAQAIAWANPLSNVLVDGDSKKSTYLTGQLANAAISNAKTPEDVKNNIKTIFGQLHIDSNTANTKLGDLANSGKIDTKAANIFQAGVNDLGLPSYQQAATAPTQTPPAQTTMSKEAALSGLANPMAGYNLGQMTPNGYQLPTADEQQALEDQINQNAQRFQ